jgi:uncharacterized membrane protein YkvI
MKALRAFQPLVSLIGLVALLIVLVTIVRVISAGAGFLVERQVVFLVWLAGLLMVSAIFAWVVRRSMRRDASRYGLLMAAAAAILLASPLALMLLQHPAP